MANARIENSSRTASRGFSLIEMMVAITLGLLLTGGLIQLFSSTKVTFNSNEALARVQENGRFAMELLKRELRPVGARGFCAGRLEIENHLNDDCSEFPSDIFAGEVGLTGWEYEGTGRGDDFDFNDLASLAPNTTSPGDWNSFDGSNLPTVLENRVVPGSDVLVVRSFAPSGIRVEKNRNEIEKIDIDGINSCESPDCGTPEPGDIILITNCASGADLFQQSKSQSPSSGLGKPNMSCSEEGPGNKPPGSSPWSTEYDESAQVFSARQVAYFVGFADGNRQEPGLYQLDLARNQATELVEGVESMQVLYGFSRTASAGGDGQSVRPGDWLTADNVPEDGFPQVIAVRISLLMRSPERADGDQTEQTFELFGEDNLPALTVTATGDGRIRQPFSTTTALRNQLLVIE